MLNPIQSARLRSSRGFNFRYGKVEVEARLPVGDWLWPGTSSLLCFVVDCGLVRHHFCALWLAVAWYVFILCFVVDCGLVRHHFVLCGWLWPGHHFCALWLAVAWYVITFVLCGWLWPGHHFCALWLAVAWYVITFVLCGWLWPGTSSLLCFVVGCGLARHHFCAL